LADGPVKGSPDDAHVARDGRSEAVHADYACESYAGGDEGVLDHVLAGLVGDELQECPDAIGL